MLTPPMTSMASAVPPLLWPVRDGERRAALIDAAGREETYISVNRSIAEPHLISDSFHSLIIGTKNKVRPRSC